MTNALSFSVKLNQDYDEAIKTVVDGLKTEGFGVVAEMDTKATFKEKINVDFRRFIILGACNPQLAHKAISSEPLVGLMLPCNVTVEETEDGGSLVNIINPNAMLAGNPDFMEIPAIQEVASEATRKLKIVAELIAK